ncbi:MAG: hypothetical protein K6T63_11705 [Alicyclobacillus herbarius]|uniref:hypothetical protein n=1 Tax=Alicyclobacillus herbarius TaxID=122960 RepID=UPI002352A762|nr:hypothetical protein [Alicyclobacillus herbarius]MCL6633282.1 hypothetical protein [Alicyclobacillus herbarius]
MKQDANKGLAKLYWVLGIIVVLFFALGAVLWWYDDYIIREHATAAQWLARLTEPPHFG